MWDQRRSHWADVEQMFCACWAAVSQSIVIPVVIWESLGNAVTSLGEKQGYITPPSHTSFCETQ